MGTWGTALFSDDLAADLRGEFLELIDKGLTTEEAVNRLKTEYKSSLRDPDEEPVFWLALADIGWRLGRLDDKVLENALRVIDSGQDLARWEDGADRRKREHVLAKLRTKLQSAPPPQKPVAKTIKSANEWQMGEVIGFRLLSGRWVLLRVIGHHEDRGGKSAVCELLNLDRRIDELFANNRSAIDSQGGWAKRNITISLWGTAIKTRSASHCPDRYFLEASPTL
jgi:hypothetical protein